MPKKSVATNQRKKSKHASRAAAALSRLGASKGGIARAQKLSKKRRQEIATKAAQIRWKKNKKNKKK